ncbi:MAG: hypothetical protein ACK4ME_08255 [Fimbriimonadales bacterium]
MNAQQYLAREYLRLLQADSGFQVDWRAVRAGEMDLHALDPLRRLLMDASREPEEPSLQRLLARIPVLEVSGYAILAPEGRGFESPRRLQQPTALTNALVRHM